ncbi:hypothetical protein [Marinomonas transparens]|uniref:Uncharacterized protein n=1 Tax=Marinomonas transparens TaxID=2795388 RepID=A0A934JTW2_9GAMM|nr:hypothetical protein [Marinomonas transparens]MBJ7539853.1 hypothetical protein [Marinomonas transparens]
MSAFIIPRKKGQGIVVIDEDCRAVAVVQVLSRKNGQTRVNVGVTQNGNIVRQQYTRKDGDQLEAGGVVFTINADERHYRTAFALDKQPKHLQVVRHENYKQALNG